MSRVVAKDTDLPDVLVRMSRARCTCMFNNFKTHGGIVAYIGRAKALSVRTSVADRSTKGKLLLSLAGFHKNAAHFSKADIPVLSSARGHYVCLTQGGSIYLFNEGCMQVLNSHHIGKRAPSLRASW